MWTRERLYTVEDFDHFLQQPEFKDRLFELIDGEIVEKMPTEEHGLIAVNVGAALHGFVRQRRVGRVGVEVRHGVPGDRLNSRMPDISFTRARRPLVRQGSVPQMPDLAVEICSPDDTIRQMRDKAAYYLAHGVRLVWLVFPDQRTVEVYRPGAQMEIVLGDDILGGGDVLPGFTLPLSEVFADFVGSELD